jgi:hypothetical protein
VAAAASLQRAEPSLIHQGVSARRLGGEIEVARLVGLADGWRHHAEALKQSDASYAVGIEQGAFANAGSSEELVATIDATRSGD